MELTKKQKEIQAKILDVIYVRGPISRIDIAHETGITPATVSSTTGYLIEDQLVEEIGEDSKGGGSGRRKILLDIKKNHKYFMGMELSEKFISMCLTDNKANLIDQEVLILEDDEKVDFLTTKNITLLINSFMQKFQQLNISAIGVALPGHHTIKDNLLLTNNPIWNNIDLNELRKIISIPMYFENNVKSMLIHKRFFRDSSIDENFMIHHISRGIFCAYMYEGELYAQENRLVGEVGHTTIQVDGELCECGNRGCLQTFSSEAWLIKKAQYIFDHVETTYLRKIVSTSSEISFKTILIAYRLGDPLITDLLQDAIQAIATNIINLSMVIDAQTIFVHGNIYDEPDLVQLLEELMEQRKPLFKHENKPRLKVMPYNTINGALGACALCVSEIYTRA